MKKNILLFAVLIILVFNLCAAQSCKSDRSQVYPITINGLKIGLNQRTGNIIELSYGNIGSFLNEKDGGLLDIAYPVTDFPPLRLSTRYSKAYIHKEGQSISIIWDSLGPSRNINLNEGNVKAAVVITPANDGRSVIFKCKIENNSSNPIPQIIFPDLYGFRPFSGIEDTQLRLGRNVYTPFKMYRENRAVQDGFPQPEDTEFYLNTKGWYPNAIGWVNYSFSGGYYSPDSLGWLDFGSLDGGLSIFHKNWRQEKKVYLYSQRTESDPMSMRLIWEHRQTIEPGEIWESNEFWLTPHRDGWTRGIEPFRKYFNTMSPPRQLPEQVKNGLGFRTIWTSEVYEKSDNVIFSYNDIPSVAKEASEHGLHEMVPWTVFNYFEFPIETRPVLGTEEEFIRAVKKSDDYGVNVCAFITIQIQLNKYAELFGFEPGTANWTYHSEFIPPMRPYYCNIISGRNISPSHPLWQKKVRENLKNWIDKGVTSFMWDVFAGPKHEDDITPLIEIVSDIKKYADKKNPNASFAGESSHFGMDTKVLDYTWNWMNYNYIDAGPMLNVTKNTRLNINIERSPLIVKKGFADNYFLNIMPKKPDSLNGSAYIKEYPDLSVALHHANRIRNQFLKFFTDGLYLGNSFITRKNELFTRGYLLEDELFVIVLNDKKISDGFAAVNIKIDKWLDGYKSYEIKKYDNMGILKEELTNQLNNQTLITDQLDYLEFNFYTIRGLKGQ